ncbi:MAG: cyclic nucleotide-binding domain-containing protein [Planctomycetota bacterium]|jgi:transcriptional regulator with AAA-type ATPase domain
MATEPNQHENTIPTLFNKTNILSKAVLDSLSLYGSEVSYPAGTTIIHRGEQGTSFYVIVSGQVEVVLGEAERRLPLACLGNGASFGEMSLLTQVPVSADVAAVTDVKLLVIPAERFQDALDASAPLRNHIFARLCENLRRTSTEAWDLFQHTQALSSLMHVPANDELLICESVAMVRLEKQMQELSCKSSPILITGEAGTGKFFIARKIHQATARRDKPLIILDCQQLDENEADKVLFGSKDVPEFTRRDSQPSGSDLQVKGALHLADGGCIVLRHIESLELSAQKNLCFYLDTLARVDDIFPQVRVLAATSEDITVLAQTGRFHPQLAEQFTDNILEIPPLRKRKRDILSLANLFLSTVLPQNEQSPYSFTKSAEHALLSGQYQHRNVVELREAVELAATFAENGQVDAEHIFTGPKSKGLPLEYDLTQNRPIQWLIRRPSLWLLQGILLALFSGVIVFCLSAGTTLIGRAANTFVWAIWWPGLLILFLFIGRLWCTVCPISAMGRIARLKGSLKLTPPAWIKNYTGWIMAFLFLFIIEVEHIFHMTSTPFATGILLLSLMSLPIFFCLIFQRETWCRYLCPLGSLAAGYSISATVQVHANPDVCASQCTTHECFKGSQTESACPVFHHPLYARDAHLCKLCFACLRSCPHQSAKVYLHPPLQNLWRLGELGKALSPVALVVFFLAIVMLSSHKLSWVANNVRFTFLAGATMVLAFILHSGLAKLFDNDQDHALTNRVAFALLILAWGPFMAFHLNNVPELDAIFLQASDSSIMSSFFNAADISLLLILQFAAVIFASVCTAVCFWRIRIHQVRNNGKSSFWSWKFVTVLCAIYLLVTIALVLYGGIIP